MFNFVSKGGRISSHARGVSDIPSLEMKEGMVLGPMLLYISWTYLVDVMNNKNMKKVGFHPVRKWETSWG